MEPPTHYDATSSALIGQRIEAYRVVRVLGEGGMGTVFLAERADGAFEQQVALKLIRYGLDDPALQRRFAHERQVLARLQHPNIARLYDGGYTKDGRPYFVMEYLEGASLTDYCDARTLSVADRLQLFRQACDAVRYAHQNLVVHRDLKPENILVTTAGQVKLLDFGIASLLGEEGDEAPAEQMLTPAYAAPEQIRGGAITPATDVYALGAILYELLTGARAHRFTAWDEATLSQVIAEQPPQPPSQVSTAEVTLTLPDGRTGRIPPDVRAEARHTSPGRLQSRLAGDLDAIILQALQKQPAARYPTAEALGQDLERYRTGFPVQARPATMGYRAAKFVQRNRLAVVATVVIVALTVGFTMRLVAARNQAQQAATEAEQVATFLIDMLAASDPFSTEEDRAVTLADLLALGVNRLGRLEAQPRLQARLEAELGQLYQSQAQYAVADSLLRSALARQRSLYGDQHPAVATSLLYLGQLYHFGGRYEEAEGFYEEALVIQRAQLGSLHPEVATSLNALARLRLDLGQAASAETLLREALAIQEAATDTTTEALRNTLRNLAAVLHSEGRATEAEGLLQRALAEAEAVHPPTHPAIIDLLNEYAVLLDESGQKEKAQPLFERILEIERSRWGDTHPNVAISSNNLAMLLFDLGQLAEAERLMREAFRIDREILGPDHPDTGSDLGNLGRMVLEQGRYDEAEALLREALAILEAKLAPDHEWIGVYLYELGLLLHETDRLAEARRAYERSYAIARLRYGPHHPDTRALLPDLLDVSMQLGDSTAAQQYRTALADTLGG